MGVQPAPRSADEAILKMLALRRTTGTQTIGAMFGKTDVQICVITDRVVNDDSKVEGRNTRAEYRFLSSSEAQKVKRRG